MEPRFRSLRVIGTIFKVLAWVVLAIGVIIGLVMLVSAVAGASLGVRYGASSGLVGGLLGALSALAAALLSFLTFYAYGDAIFLALAIEENTRETAYYLKGGDNYGQQM